MSDKSIMRVDRFKDIPYFGSKIKDSSFKVRVSYAAKHKPKTPVYKKGKLSIEWDSWINQIVSPKYDPSKNEEYLDSLMKLEHRIRKKDLIKVLEDINSINRFLRETDWTLYNNRVTHAVSVPDCSIYDGRYFCPVWEGWIKSGRELYPKDEKGKKEYVESLRRVAPNLKVSEIELILDGKVPKSRR